MRPDVAARKKEGECNSLYVQGAAHTQRNTHTHLTLYMTQGTELSVEVNADAFAAQEKGNSSSS